MKRFLFFTLLFCLGSVLYAQKDTVYVPGYYSNYTYGTLNDSIEVARENGTINNTVFKLDLYDVYVLSRSIFMSFDEDLEIVAPEPGTTQETCPPQIVWTEESITKTYLIQTYGDVTLKNLWIRCDDFSGAQQQTGIVFEDSVAIQGEDVERGTFEGCIFDYSEIASESGGTITVKADHFVGNFTDCYFRNLSDTHFQYYGRAVSFPYESSGFHCDTLLFENCTFSNLSRVVMQEGNEYCDNVFLNHCTLINAVEWVYQSAGWLNNAAITNSIFVNPYMMGYRAVDVCDDDQDYDDFEDGLCDSPDGGLLNGITAVDSFGFTVDFTDADRSLYIGNNVYMYQDWLVDWYTECESAQELIQQRTQDEVYNPLPMLGDDEYAFIDSTDGDGNKVFETMNVDTATIYDDDPGFVVEPTNEDTLKIFLEGKWYTGADIDWSYRPDVTYNQTWPLPEDLAYTNTTYQTAAMGGYPLGDLNWYPTQKESWEAQRDDEWDTIIGYLENGVGTGIEEISGTLPSDYVLKQNYPNPFNPSTNIEYSIPSSGYVSLKVYNLLGQEVATLFNGEQNAGSYKVTFDAGHLASGVYMYKLQSDNVSITKKFILMK